MQAIDNNDIESELPEIPNSMNSEAHALPMPSNFPRPCSAKHSDIKGSSVVNPMREELFPQNPYFFIMMISARGYNRPMTGSNVPTRGFTSNNFDKPLASASLWHRMDRYKTKDSSAHLNKEAIKLKKHMNRFQDENLKLKTRIQQSGKELEKKQKIIQGLMDQINSESGKCSNQYFEAPAVLSLKRQLKELKEEEKIKDDEMNNLKNGLKISRFKELDNELKANEKECARLKTIVVNLLNNQSDAVSPEDIAILENNVAQQEAMINSLKEENFKLVNDMQAKENELVKLKQTSGKFEKRIGKAESNSKENVKSKKVLAENIKEIEKLKQQIEHYKVDNKEKEALSLKETIDKLIKQQSELNGKIKDKDLQIQSFQQKAGKVPIQYNASTELTELKTKIQNCI